MKPSPDSEYVPGQPGARFEPYVQLLRSLLPRTSSVAMFEATGELLWSTDTMTGPDLINIVDDALLSVCVQPAERRASIRLLAGNLPVYLCWLRDDAAAAAGAARVVCRPGDDRPQATISPSPTRSSARRSSACGAI